MADPDEDARPDPIMQLVACKLGCTLPEGDVSQARPLPSDALTVQQLAKVGTGRRFRWISGCHG